MEKKQSYTIEEIHTLNEDILNRVTQDYIIAPDPVTQEWCDYARAIEQEWQRREDEGTTFLLLHHYTHECRVEDPKKRKEITALTGRDYILARDIQQLKALGYKPRMKEVWSWE